MFISVNRCFSVVSFLVVLMWMVLWCFCVRCVCLLVWFICLVSVGLVVSMVLLILVIRFISVLYNGILVWYMLDMVWVNRLWILLGEMKWLVFIMYLVMDYGGE